MVASTDTTMRVSTSSVTRRGSSSIFWNEPASRAGNGPRAGSDRSLPSILPPTPRVPNIVSPNKPNQIQTNVNNLSINLTSKSEKIPSFFLHYLSFISNRSLSKKKVKFWRILRIDVAKSYFTAHFPKICSNICTFPSSGRFRKPEIANARCNNNE